MIWESFPPFCQVSSHSLNCFFDAQKFVILVKSHVGFLLLFLLVLSYLRNCCQVQGYEAVPVFSSEQFVL